MATVLAQAVDVEQVERPLVQSIIEAMKGEPFLVLGVPAMGSDLVVIVPDFGNPADYKLLNLGSITGVQQAANNHRQYSVHTRLMRDQNVWVELHPGVN